jgi:hypothetical protein
MTGEKGTIDRPVLSRDAFAEHLEKVFECLRALRAAGHAEYAGGENAFGNFVRLSDDLGIPAPTVLMTYLAKHLDGIRSWIRGYRSQREGVQGRIRDAMLYLALLDGMVESARRSGV